MAATTVSRRLTATEFAALPDTKSYELVNGERVPIHSSVLAGFTSGELLSRIGMHAKEHDFGITLGASAGLQCFSHDPESVRRPDGFFISKQRFKDAFWRAPFLPIPPDLVVEVIAPQDRVYALDAMIQDYLAAGVRLIWVVDPVEPVARVHRAIGSVAIIREGDELDGEDVLPGFLCGITDLRPPMYSSRSA